MAYSSYSPEDEDSKQQRWLPAVKVLAAVTFVLALLGGCLVYWVKHQDQNTYDPYADIYMAQDRNYQLTPFDILDATHYCQHETERKFGDQLALSYVDEHSTRYDADKGLYKIFMVAHVGTLDDYEETNVHCFVDQYRYKLTHYRTIKVKDPGIMSKAWKFIVSS